LAGRPANFFIPVHSQSGIETGMVRGLAKRSATGIRLFIWHIPIAKQTFVCQWLLPNTTHSSSHHPSLPPTFVALHHCHHHLSLRTIAHPAPPHHQPPWPITFIDHQQRRQHTNNPATPRHHQTRARSTCRPTVALLNGRPQCENEDMTTPQPHRSWPSDVPRRCRRGNPIQCP
jgi:hypothetical protein